MADPTESHRVTWFHPDRPVNGTVYVRPHAPVVADPHRSPTWPFPCKRCDNINSCRCIFDPAAKHAATVAVRQRHAASVARAHHAPAQVAA